MYLGPRIRSLVDRDESSFLCVMDPNLRLERHRDYLRERRGTGIRALNERPWYIKAKNHSSNYITQVASRKASFNHPRT